MSDGGLCELVEEGSLEKVRMALRQPGVDVNRPGGKFKRTPLCAAVAKNYGQIFDLLLGHHAIDVNAVDADPSGNSPLHWAAEKNRVEVARQLLKHAAINVNLCAKKTASTPLHKAVKKHRLEIVNLLLGHPSIDVNAIDSSKISTLYIAAQRDLREITKSLLDIPGIDVNAAHADGRSPLYVAAQKNHEEIAGLLLNHPKIDVNLHAGEPHIKSNPLIAAVLHDSVAVVELLLKHSKIEVNATNGERRSPLYVAALENRVAITRLLLGHADIDVNVTDVDGKSPLYVAAKENHGEITCVLLERPEIDVNATDVDGISPLQLAAKRNYEEITSRLVDHPAIDVNLQAGESQPKSNPLIAAVLNNSAEVVDRLLNHPKIDVNAIDSRDGYSPLLWAVVKNRVKIVSQLLARTEIDVNHFSSQLKRTALHLAAITNHVQIVTLLLRYSELDVNVKDVNDCTPLHLACQHGYAETVRKILEGSKRTGLDIDINLRATGGITALHLAANSGNADVVQLLLAMPNIKLDAVAEVGKFTALHVAALRGKALAVKFILQTHRKNLLPKKQISEAINARDVLARTPLHYAAWNNRVPVVQQLLKEEVLEANAVERSGRTALHVAAKKGHDRIVKLLLSNKTIDPNVNATKSSEVKEVDQTREILELPKERLGLLKLEDDWFVDDRWGMTPLHYAVEEGHVEVVKDLVTHPSIDVHLPNSDKKSAFDVSKSKVEFMGKLIKAFEKSAREEDTEKSWENFPWTEVGRIVREVHPHIETVTKEKYGVTLLHDIALTGLHEWMESIILSRRWDVNARDSDGQTPLHFATAGGHIAIAELLLRQRDLRANLEDRKGRSVLQIAIQRQNTDIEKLLLDRDDVREYVDRLRRDRQVHVDAANAILVVGALIASVTFAGWLQPPLGYTPYYEFADPDAAAPPGTVASYAGVKQHLSIRVFWVCNSLSFFLAIATVIAGAGAVLPTQDITVKVLDEIKMVRRSVVMASVLIVFALVFVLGAFGAAGFASLPPIMSLEMNMIVTCCIGVVICVPLLGLFLTRLYRIRPAWMRCPCIIKNHGNHVSLME